MASNKTVILGPVAFATSVATIFSPPTTTGGTNVPPVSTNTYYIIRHIRIVNTAASAGTFSLYKNSSAAATAGKEIIGTALSVAANSAFDWYGALRLSSDETNNLIVGLASATTMVIQAEAEMGIV